VPSRIVTRLAIAVTVPLVAEVSDLLLDKAGMSGTRSQLPRALLKSSIATLSAVLLSKALHEPDQRKDSNSEQVYVGTE
jgi:hypothetical protein